MHNQLTAFLTLVFEKWEITRLKIYKPPSWTCVHGRRPRRWGSGHDVDHTQPSCSWRRISAALARAQSGHDTAGCRVTSVEQSLAWRNADVGMEPCWRPVYAGQHSAVTFTINSIQFTIKSMSHSIITYPHWLKKNQTSQHLLMIFGRDRLHSILNITQ